jgi:hypothetical protein
VSTLEHWRFEADGGDWADVLGRAGVRAPRRARRRAALVAALAVALAAPAALAIVAVTHTLGSGAAGGGPRLEAGLRGDNGAAGTFVATAPRVWLRPKGPGLRIPWRLIPTNHRVLRTGTVTFVWELELRGSNEPVSSVRIRRANGTVVTTLCAPCNAQTTGKSKIALRRAAGLFSEQPSVEVVAGAQTLRGPLVLRPLRR